ncbi:hypothetical protein BKA83DRAFT_4275252, partial [Pisolithus microcarpus]
TELKTLRGWRYVLLKFWMLATTVSAHVMSPIVVWPMCSKGVRRSKACQAASTSLPTNAGVRPSVTLRPLSGSTAPLLLSPSGSAVVLTLLLGTTSMAPVSKLSASP